MKKAIILLTLILILTCALASCKNEHVHVFVDGEIETYGCTEARYLKKICEGCDEFMYEELPPLGHVMGEWEIVEYPTLASSGLKRQTCENCTYYMEEYIPQLTDELEYTLNADKASYSVTGIGGYSDSNVVIDSVYNGLPVTAIGYHAFQFAYEIKSVTIPDSVTSIGIAAFDSCYRLEEINLPDNLTHIPDYAFMDCESLLSLTIPSSVSYIGEGAFYRCAALTNIVIPKGALSIGSEAFRECTSLESITIPNSVKSIAGAAFYKCVNLKNITIPSGVTSIEIATFGGCTNLQSITISDSVTKICKEAFNSCSSLTEITIPDSVTEIGEKAFYGCSSLTEITIPDSVTKIGKSILSECPGITYINITDIAKWCALSFDNYNDNPFEGNRDLYLNGELVTELVIPEGVTFIGNYAFANSTVTRVILSDSVTSVGNGAFYGCGSLTYVSLGTGIDATSIQKDTFAECTSFDSVSIPDLALWCAKSFEYNNSVFSGGKYLYVDGELVTDLVIPSDITSIGSYVFKDAKISSVVIHDGITSIGNGAFNSTSIESVTVPSAANDNYIFGNVFYWTVQNVVVLGGDRIAEGFLYGFNSIKSLTIPFVGKSPNEETYNFFSYIFHQSGYSTTANSGYLVPEKLTTVTITGGSTISRSAFAGCKYIENIIITGGVQTVDYYAFYNCTGLKNVMLGEGVTSVASYAFYNCSSLTSLSVPNSINFFAYNAIDNSGMNGHIYDKALYLGNEDNPYVVLLKSYEYYNGSQLSPCTIHEDTKIICTNAFNYRPNLRSVTIPEGVISIGDQAFYACTMLTNVTIPDSVISIGDQAFRGCTSLTKVTLGSGITSISDGTFYNCTNLASINIPSGVTSIGDATFYNCTNLASINIPNSVTSIGDDAFCKCKALESIYIPASVTTMGQNVFLGCGNLTISCGANSEPADWPTNWSYVSDEWVTPVFWGVKEKSQA